MLSDDLVRIVWRGDHGEMNLRNRQQVVDSSHDASIRIELRCFVPAALDNCRKVQTWDGMNHRRVKCATRQAKSDEPNVDHGSKRLQNSTKRVHEFDVRRGSLRFTPNLPMAVCSFRMIRTHVHDYHGSNPRTHQ